MYIVFHIYFENVQYYVVDLNMDTFYRTVTNI